MQRRILAAACEQFIVGAAFYDATLIKYANQIRIAHR